MLTVEERPGVPMIEKRIYVVRSFKGAHKQRLLGRMLQHLVCWRSAARRPPSCSARTVNGFQFIIQQINISEFCDRLHAFCGKSSLEKTCGNV